MSASFEYKGRKVEIKPRKTGYSVFIDGSKRTAWWTNYEKAENSAKKLIDEEVGES